MIQIALYGKGGIGKSTASANISYTLAGNGLKVLQFGCDPKHDSTRLLLNGKSQITILDHIRSGSEDHGEVIRIGKNGVVCLETGGPEPGVGCAGRGILTAFDFVKQHSVIPEDTDVSIYDVLGDVVCGGFAVPLRREYADAVFIVTSGEFMSLYAANNVLKGIRNFDSIRGRVAGLILNSRGNDGEYDYVRNFADAVGLPIVAVIPRSKRFSEAESEGRTVAEMFPDSPESESYLPIIRIIEGLGDGSAALYPPHPLDDEDMDLIAKGIPVPKRTDFSPEQRKLATDERSTLKSCGIRAAARCCMEINDATIISHGPMSCAYMFGNVYDRGLLYDGNTEVPSINTRLFSTNLDDCASIYGGADQLTALIEERISRGDRLIFVMPTCVPGIIGDDTEDICFRLEKKHPGVRIIPVPMDGILCGGAIQGRDMAYEKVCSLVDPEVEPQDRCVNIIGYHDSEDRTLMALDDTERILGSLGYSINCRFLHHNDLEDVRDFRRGSFNIMFAQSVALSREAKIIRSCTGIGFYREPLPYGLEKSIAWIRAFAESMDIDPSVSENLCSQLESEYDRTMDSLKGTMRDSSCIVYIDSSSDVDWLLEILDNLGVHIPKIMCPVNSVWNFADDNLVITRRIPIEYGKNLDALKEEISRSNPSFVIGSQQTLSNLNTPRMIVERPRPGIRGCLEIAERIVRMYKVSRYGSY